MNIIFVPGIKGSILERGGKRIWLNLSEAFFNSPSLKYSENDGITATGVLRNLKIIPGLIKYRIYDEITARLDLNPNSHFFFYDWRDYPDNNSRKFGELVEKIIRETGEKPSVIAHSMGGLIAHGYIKQHPDNVDKVVYASVPFKPGVAYFDDVNNGSWVGLNSRILSKEVLFSHPASFLLMPHRGSNRYFGKELMDAETWSRNKFSIFKDGQTDLGNFQKMLDRVSDYHKLLDAPKILDNKFLFIISQCHKTLFAIDEKGKSIYAPGDGRVSENSAYPLDILSNKKIEIFCQRHEGQMNDEAIIRKIFDFLNFS